MSRRMLIKQLDDAGPDEDLARASAREIRSLVAIARHGWLEAKERILSERRARGDQTLYIQLMTQVENVLAELETDL